MPALAESLAFASNPSWGTRTHSSRASWVSTAAFQPLMGNKNPRIDPQADRITHDAGRPGEQRGRPFGCRVFQPLMGNKNRLGDADGGRMSAFQPLMGNKNDRAAARNAEPGACDPGWQTYLPTPHGEQELRLRLRPRPRSPPSRSDERRVGKA